MNKYVRFIGCKLAEEKEYLEKALLLVSLCPALKKLPRQNLNSIIDVGHVR
jgi:hypothetical protein